MPLAERVALLRQAAVAVRFAHARLVVHADLKPSNIVVDEGGRVRLLDFGVARLIGDDGGRGAPDDPRLRQSRATGGARPMIADDVFALGRLLATADRRRARRRSRRHCRPRDRGRGTATLHRGGRSPRRSRPLARPAAGKSARAPTVRYRAGRFLARHRLGVGADRDRAGAARRHVGLGASRRAGGEPAARRRRAPFRRGPRALALSADRPLRRARQRTGHRRRRGSASPRWRGATRPARRRCAGPRLAAAGDRAGVRAAGARAGRLRRREPRPPLGRARLARSRRCAREDASAERRRRRAGRTRSRSIAGRSRPRTPARARSTPPRAPPSLARWRASPAGRAR